ncbi:queuosine precursor transporter [uncultured Sphaerochaeta sp.]|uniref:queuosine precursor transporter n=1 Tax=uncultured Sphaerochaeta sp. TaxID=886478 RepID=UPI002A0A63BE|nr:queuosine precursor transporter [uncultured Sphaerochaeta sp.]
MNELYWIVLLILDFIAIMVAFRLWGKLGLYIWVPISIIVANIQVTKTISLFGLEATLGNIVYATSFLATDILSEFFGEKASKKAVAIGFFSLLSMTVLMQVALLFEPSSSDIAQGALSTVFGLMPRIAAGSLIAYVLSNYHDILAFSFWKKRKPGRNTLWLRNNLSTFVSQAIDTLVFTLIAFWGVYPKEVLIQIMISTYVLKWAVALCDTPFIYLARHWVESGKIEEITS